MKKLLILIGCIASLAALAQVALQPAFRGAAAKPTVTAGGGAFFPFVETFDTASGTGYDRAEWTTSGTSNPNSTTTVLEGTQSWTTAVGANAYAQVDFGEDCNDLYLYCRWRRSSMSNLSAVLRLLNSSDASIAGLSAGNGANSISHGANTSNGSSSADTTYHCWFEYHKGTGLDGVLNYYQATSSTKPGSPTLTLTTGTATTAARKLRIYSGTTADGTFIIDRVIVSKSAIGSAP